MQILRAVSFSKWIENYGLSNINVFIMKFHHFALFTRNKTYSSKQIVKVRYVVNKVKDERQSRRGICPLLQLCGC